MHKFIDRIVLKYVAENMIRETQKDNKKSNKNKIKQKKVRKNSD